MVKVRNEIKSWNASKKSHESMVASLEEMNLTLKERVKILQSKYDESESRRVKLTLELEEVNKDLRAKESEINDLENNLN